MSPVRIETFASYVALVTLDRPARRNAIDEATANALADAVASTEADGTIRAVVLTGAGSAFCAGADLTGHARGTFRLRGEAEGGFAGFVLARRTKPWIAAVNGPGGRWRDGDHAGLRYRNCSGRRSLWPAGGQARPDRHRWRRASACRAPCHGRFALRMILTGDTIDAETALRWGLVTEIVPLSALLDAARTLATSIAANAPRAVRESLAVARETPFLTQQAAMALAEAATWARVMASVDAIEGPRAFLERRDPQWTDH